MSSTFILALDDVFNAKCTLPADVSSIHAVTDLLAVLVTSAVVCLTFGPGEKAPLRTGGTLRF